ncbi:MAG: SusD/RagB family nutrient-binding outer membrane lipoprotein [Filimonas sp.]|nr:SusD/RagB family nutrient-binding outer membrane lipoprotein [Filimonas sp.]
MHLLKKGVYSLSTIVASCVLLASCKKSAFVETNTDPATLYTVAPEDQFFAASTGSQDDFEAFYDNYRRIMLWTQMTTPASGNKGTFTNDVSNMNTRFQKIFYGRIGPRLTDAMKLIEKMSAQEQAKRVYEKAEAAVFIAYYTFYVTDANGSMPYTQAFQARYGGAVTPKYDTQDSLFSTLDKQVKDAVALLKTTQSTTQLSYGKNDQFFGGDATKWAKAGNALRLRMAMRLLKRDAARAKTIINEVLADPVQMTSNSDGWVLIAPSTFADATSNWNIQDFRAPKPVVEFMKAKSDPRLRLFYMMNKYNQYIGNPTNPDEAKDPANARLYSNVDTLSQMQIRLFTPNFNNGTGTTFFPFITYADLCFMRAELAASGVSTENAASWYNMGVTASIQFYNAKAIDAKIDNLTPVTQPEIDAYLSQPGIQFNAAKALDQIASQAYLDFLKQPNEVWALWKRTGMPNNTTSLPLSALKNNGADIRIPRRMALDVLPTSDLNYANQKAAFDQMAQDPGFGQGPTDAFGRVWWDKQ